MTDAHTLTRDQIIKLQEERDTLREEVRQLREALVVPVAIPSAWGLTAMEERLLRGLRAAGPSGLFHERAFITLSDFWNEPPRVRTLHVHIHRIRRRLEAAQSGVVIDVIYGRGWRMSAESCAAFDAALSADQARWPGMGRAAA